jgi:glutaredoxin
MAACKRPCSALPVLTYISTLRAGSRSAPFSARPEPNLDTPSAWNVSSAPGTSEAAPRFIDDGQPTVLKEQFMPGDKTATLYRMILPEETCPFGVHARQLLEDNGYTIDEHILRSRDEVEAFEDEHGVETTPQVFIGGERIGGSDDLELYLSRQ